MNTIYKFEEKSKNTDWKEKIGYFLLRPHFAINSYCKISFQPNLRCKEVIPKIDSCFVTAFASSYNFFGANKLGKLIMHSSSSYKQKYRNFKFQVNEKMKQRVDLQTNLKEEFYHEINFYSQMDRYLFLLGVFEQYNEAVRESESCWSSQEELNFLREELCSLYKETKQIITCVSNLILRHEKKLGEDENQDLIQMHELIDGLVLLKKNYKEIIECVEKKLPSASDSVIGIANNRNTCYINSCLQVLLAIHNFPDLIPDCIEKIENESIQEFEGRQKILKSFKKVIEAYEEKSSPKNLGKLIGKLRTKIFKVGLKQGGFIDKYQEYSLQDAGSFFELILHVISKRYVLKTTKSFAIDAEENRKEIVEIFPQGVFFLKQKEGFIQDKIDAFAENIENELPIENPYIHNDDNENLLLTKFVEKNEVISNPEEILILHIHKYKIDLERDLVINCRKLFGLSTDSHQAEYELIGFLQNQRHHWTSIVKKEESWKYCNDSTVETISLQHQQFKNLASYFVYKKREINHEISLNSDI